MQALAAEAATRGIPGITNSAVQMADTIKAIGYLVAPALVIAAVYEARQHAGFGVLFTLIGVIITIGVIVFADEIVNTIKPGSALAFTGMEAARLPWIALGDLGQSGLMVTGLTEVIRRVRRAGRL